MAETKTPKVEELAKMSSASLVEVIVYQRQELAALSEKLQQAERERDEWRERHTEASLGRSAANSLRKDAERRIEELEPDAKRYRWAREQIYYKPPGYDGYAKGRWVWDWTFESENGSDLDAAIDAAALKESP